MTDRFIIHFSVVLGLHISLFFAGGHLFKEQIVSTKLSGIGSRRLILNVGKGDPRPIAAKTLRKVLPLSSTRHLPPHRILKPQNESHPLPENFSSTTGSGPSRDTTLKDIYKAELRDRIFQNQLYPGLSRRLGQQGTVIVAFTLLEDGNIINVRIDTPSTFERLNDSAMAAVKKVARFKPIPKEIGEQKMELRVPVEFKLL